MAAFFFILMASLLVACDIREVTETETPLPETNSITSEPSPLTAVIEGLSIPSRYRVSLNWNETDLSLYRKQAHTAYQKLDSAEGKFKDETVVSGEKYRYALFDSSLNKSVTELEVDIPKDLVIDKPILMQEILDYERLFLTSAAVVRGNGVLKIMVKEIHSEGGRIENRTHGGGIVTIEAERAVGSLEVATVGTDGKEGRPGSEGLTGKNGNPGEDGKLTPKGLNPGLTGQLNDFLLEKKLTLNELSEEQIKLLFECKTAPTDGEPGGKGGPGGTGERGADGSDSGKIWVKIRYADQFHLTTRVESGKGGLGGKPGVGGLGGLGGDPGKDYAVCRKAKSGKRGEHGEVGKPGDSGGSGVTLTPCLLLGATKVGDCENFPRL